MLFDTLYGQAGAAQGFAAKPQMVVGHTIENDGTRWTMTLREGLMFHDGSKVLARDCVASIRRWGVRDLFGQTLMQRTDELLAPDDRTIIFRLRKPFPTLPDTLGKFGVNMCAIMPERIANGDPYEPIREIVGSGPFRFRADEEIPGALHPYERFDRYQPRTEGYAEFVSGPKVVHFDRVEWHVHPDQTSVIGALRSGELDWDEYVLDDVVPALRSDGRIKLERVGSAGYFGFLRPNCLFPPFDNPATRRALVGAIDQAEFMVAAIGPDPSQWTVPTGYFPPNSPLASDVGLGMLTSPRDLGQVRSDLKAAGYGGEKIVLIIPSSLLRLKIFSQVAADLLRKVGMNVDEQVMDSATWARRLISKKPPDQGGWNILCDALQWIDALTPATHLLLRGNGEQGSFGWPSSPELESLREQWLDAADHDTQRSIAAQLQAQAFMDVPYVPLGTFYPSTAYRSDLVGVLDGEAIFWNVRRV
jgi:peptide/nickel transport system substrate-binding protein